MRIESDYGSNNGRDSWYALIDTVQDLREDLHTNPREDYAKASDVVLLLRAAYIVFSRRSDRVETIRLLYANSVGTLIKHGVDPWLVPLSASYSTWDDRDRDRADELLKPFGLGLNKRTASIRLEVTELLAPQLEEDYDSAWGIPMAASNGMPGVDPNEDTPAGDYPIE